MYVVTINTDECSGCGECVESCPAQILGLVEGKAQVTGEASECLGCESCVVVCSAGHITVQEF